MTWTIQALQAGPKKGNAKIIEQPPVRKHEDPIKVRLLGPVGRAYRESGPSKVKPKLEWPPLL